MRELEIYNDKKNNKGWLIALILLLVATVIALVVLLLLKKDDKGDEKSKGDVELVAQGDEGIPDDYDGCVPTAFGDDVVYVPLPRGDVEYDAKRVVDFALELQEKVTNAELLERFDEITAEMDKNIEEFYDNDKAKMEQFGKELERLSELPEYKERFKKMADRMGRIEKGTVVNEVEAKPSSVEPKIPDLPEETDEEVRTISEATNEQARPTKPVAEKVYTSVEQMPSFPGGDAALKKYISTHLNYSDMIESGLREANVVVQFVVTKTGDVGEVKVVRSVNPGLDSEAVRVCKSLPRFQPGKHKGEPVNVCYTLPVSFKL